MNEYRRPASGHYRVYAVSSRVWRPADASDKSPYTRVAEAIRSNSVEFDAAAPDPAWQSEQLQRAIQALDGSSTPEEASHAARVLRFQYHSLSREQPEIRLAQFPAGTRMTWPVRSTGNAGGQEALYERMRDVAEKHGIILDRKNEP